MADKLSLLAENVHVDTSGVASSASSAETEMPLSHLAVPQPGKRWSATSADATPYVRFDHGEAVTVDTIWLVNFSGGLDDTVTITATDNADYATAPLLSESYDLWLPIYGAGDLAGVYAGGYVSPEELDLWVPVRPIRLASQVTARYWEYRFSETGARLGYVMAGVAIPFEHNFGYPFGVDEVDPTTVRETEGGGVIVDARRRHPVFRVPFPALRRGEAFGKWRQVKRRGKEQPVALMLFPDASGATLYQTAVYGLIEEWAPAEHYEFDLARSSLTIRGLI